MGPSLTVPKYGTVISRGRTSREDRKEIPK
jgi:hypothetical protein